MSYIQDIIIINPTNFFLGKVIFWTSSVCLHVLHNWHNNLFSAIKLQLKQSVSQKGEVNKSVQGATGNIVLNSIIN